MLFFPVSLAYAQDAAPAGGLSGLLSIAPLIVLVVIFYFLLIRPQQKKAKEHKQMISTIQKGDNIITTGGIYGRVTAVSDDAFTVEIADNVRVKIAKDAVAVKK